MCICLWPEFDCHEVTLCGWQNIKIQLLLLLALVQQLRDDSRLYVSLAAIWHWYLSSCIYILIYHINCFCPFLSTLFLNLIWINYPEWSTIPACPSLMCSFDRGDNYWRDSLVENVCLMFVYICFVLCLLMTQFACMPLQYFCFFDWHWYAFIVLVHFWLSSGCW